MGASLRDRAGGLKPRAMLHCLGLSALIACAGCAKAPEPQQTHNLSKGQHWVNEHLALNLNGYTGTTTGRSCIYGEGVRRCSAPTVTHFVKGNPMTETEARQLVPCVKGGPDYSWCDDSERRK